MIENPNPIIWILLTVSVGCLIALYFDLQFEVKRIRNCFGQLYMTRIILWRFRSGAKVMINVFHRSDEDRDLHDHPWHFRTFILWNGYFEHHVGGVRSALPLMTLVRPAQWRHRVELRKHSDDGSERMAVTLVFTGPKVREWGYHTKDGWISHEDWWQKMGCE
jgi:hypothetical protein